MSSNKKVKEALIKRYGNQCFIEKLKLRDTKGMKYKGCKQYKRMKQLTYHHIKMKKDGGKATIENGALLSTENHEWFHKQSESDQRIMNDMFQELKRKIDSQELKVEIVEEIECPLNIGVAEIVCDDNGILFKGLTPSEKKAKQKAKEKRELQRIRKEFEDR